jgi:sugar O-acyltransferase (sialic acid O-acetyltransferase NeuD family)
VPAEQIVVVGAGGFGRDLLHLMAPAIERAGHSVAGFLDDAVDARSAAQLGAPMLGSIADHDPHDGALYVLAIGEPSARERCADLLTARGARFAPLVHPTAVVAASARVGEGFLAYPFTLIGREAEVGDHVCLNAYASLGHDVQVGAYSILSPYATVNGHAILGRRVFMGTQTNVAVGCAVGDDVKVSSGATVHRDVPPRHMVFQERARTLRRRS